MKTKVLFIIVVLVTASIFAQRGVRIAYIDMEYILENVDEYKEANSQLSTKAEKWKSEIEAKKGTIEQMRKNLSAEKILLTKELVQEREEEIQILEKEMLDYQQNRFGPRGDLIIQRNQLAKPVQDQVFNAVQDIVEARKYDFVFDKSADVVMLYSNKRHDISDLVLRSINRTRKQDDIKSKNKKNKTPESVAEETPNPALEAKKEAAAVKQEEQATALEVKKQQKIDEREARKKAYEERKKKILAEKEAKRKAKLEEREKKKDDNNKTNETEENNNN